MANYYEPTDDEKQEWSEWLSSRPVVIQQLGEQFQPWGLYKLKNTGQCVYPCAFNEDGSLTVVVSAEFNAVLEERQVFGVLPKNLEPCELPGKGAAVGYIVWRSGDIQNGET